MTNLPRVVTDTTQLVPVYLGTIGGVPAHVVDARELHSFLENGDLFANWIKSRIEKYGFDENQDFALVLENSKIKKGRGGDRRSKDYLITLDMAKELSMVENNDKGREVRRYFIAMERKALEAAGQPVLPSPTDTILPSEAQTLKEIVYLRAAEVPTELEGKARAEIWTRVQRKFRANSYLLLPRDKLSDAIAYVMKMDLRCAPPAAAPAAPEPDASVPLSRDDLRQVRHVVDLISRWHHHERAWSNGVWAALRQATGTPAPEPFRAGQLPTIAGELMRVWAISESLNTAIWQAEKEALKRLVRQREEAGPLLAELRTQMLTTATDERAEMAQMLERWQLLELVKLIKPARTVPGLEEFELEEGRTLN